MFKRRHLTALFVSAGIIAFGVGVIFLIQHISEQPEAHLLSHDAPPAGLGRGKVLLSLSSAMVSLEAGPPGGPLRVESGFDPDVYTLEHSYEEGKDGKWIFHLDFHERSLLHISVIGIWLGKRSPEVAVQIPADLPFDLEATMEGGYLVMDFANLALSTADVELDRGVVQVSVSDPMDVPMKRLNLSGRIGTMFLNRLGNASPETLVVHHGLGAAQVDLRGLWRRDADVDFEVAFGAGELRLPGDVRIDGLGRPLESLSERELPPPTLRISTHFDIGDIRVTD
jgi:hypothetical protein